MKNITKTILSVGFLIVMVINFSCSGTKDSKESQEDSAAKDTLQGVWVNDLEGNTVFSIMGDSIFFNDSLSTPSTFYVHNDTIIIRYHNEVRYPIKKLTAHSLTFINQDGDEVELTKQSEKVQKTQRPSYPTPTQGKTIKKDSVMNVGENHFHAYTTLTPTQYKVYRQNTNTDGMSVQTVYYDNTVHIELFNGQRKIFWKNIMKNDFARLVPKTYLSQAILTDIIIDSANSKGVRFIAVLTIPDSYTTYRVNIDVTTGGKKSYSL